jgi:hypothetical protein
MKLKEYDVVRLLRPLPQHRLPAGATGAIVMVYPSPLAYEVEFADEHGITIALVTLKGEDLEMVNNPTPPASSN